jgi:hypothetical protein
MQTVQEKTITKQDFVNALRSGNYKQCYGGMKDSNGAFCAMGVYHVLHGDGDIDDITISFKVHSSVFNSIARLNDAGATFDEIAKYVESLSDDNFYAATTD